MGKKNERPRGWYIKEQRKELRHKITLVKKWIAECTDCDRLHDLKEHLWRLEYREMFIGKRK